MYILIAILIFGVLIAVHELGHFLAAKAFGVRVNEFSIGMGPCDFAKKERGYRIFPAYSSHWRLLCHGGRRGGFRRPEGFK